MMQEYGLHLGNSWELNDFDHLSYVWNMKICFPSFDF